MQAVWRHFVPQERRPMLGISTSRDPLKWRGRGEVCLVIDETALPPGTRSFAFNGHGVYRIGQAYDADEKWLGAGEALRNALATLEAQGVHEEPDEVFLVPSTGRLHKADSWLKALVSLDPIPPGLQAALKARTGVRHFACGGNQDTLAAALRSLADTSDDVLNDDRATVVEKAPEP